MYRIIGFFTFLLVVIVSFTPNAHASVITYEITGVASGQIGTTTFTNATVNLIGTGDTANIGSGGGFFATPFSNFIVTISGVGTATVIDPSAIWVAPVAIIDPKLPPEPFVLIGRIDHPPALDSFTGLGVVASNALAGYELNTAIGPITDLGGIGFPACGGPGQDPCVHTSLGLLSFTSNVLSGDATFVATTAPEPGTLLLLGSGVAMLVGWSRFRTRHSDKNS